MDCPSCGYLSKVVDTRKNNKGRRRNYACSNCGHNFRTQEVIVSILEHKEHTRKSVKTFDLYVWRKYMGLSQKETASALGITKTVVSNIKRGLRPMCKKIMLACLYIEENSEYI